MPKRPRTRTYAVPTRGASPEVNSVLRRLRRLGLKLEFSAGANHWRVIDPGTGAFLTTVSGTPSDVNFWQHIRRAVERAGFSWEGHKRKKIKKPRGEEISSLDLEALGHAQRLARIHGGREPQIDDLADSKLLAKIRRGFNEQETEEAIQHMAHGVDSARAHRVVSRLLYMVEQRGDEMKRHAQERNPKIREGGITHEMMHISEQVAKERGLRWWKSQASAWQTFTNILSGASRGMSPWVANLLEATMDHMDGLQWDNRPQTPPEPVAIHLQIPTAEEPEAPTEPEAPIVKPELAAVPVSSPAISLEDAKSLVVDLLNQEWTRRPDIHDMLVPEMMTDSRFKDALGSLVKAKRVKRERERKVRGQMLYQLVMPKVAPKPAPVKKPDGLKLSQAESEEIMLSLIPKDWTIRNHIMGLAAVKGVPPRSSERALSALVREGHVERERLSTGKTRYRRIAPKSVVVPEPVIIPDLSAEPSPRSISESMTGGSIADRYADALLDILRMQTANGTTDWRHIEPVLQRLDKLAGVGQE